MTQSRGAQILAHPGFSNIDDDPALDADRRWFREHPDRLFHGRRLFPEELRWSGLSADEMTHTRMVVCRSHPSYAQEGDPEFVRCPIRLKGIDDTYDLPDDEHALTKAFELWLESFTKRSVN